MNQDEEIRFLRGQAKELETLASRVEAVMNKIEGWGLSTDYSPNQLEWISDLLRDESGEIGDHIEELVGGCEQ